MKEIREYVITWTFPSPHHAKAQWRRELPPAYTPLEGEPRIADVTSGVYTVVGKCEVS